MWLPAHRRLRMVAVMAVDTEVRLAITAERTVEA
jgi:hypothetical protein